jgi:hypothetical protein
LNIVDVAGDDEITNDNRDGETGDADGKEDPSGINSRKVENDTCKRVP